MKWVSHRICTFGTVSLITGNIFYGALSFLASCIPDQVEGKPPDEHKEYKKYWAWRKKHRTYSHLPLLYAAVGAVYFFIRSSDIIPEAAVHYTDYIYWLLLGCLMHIAEDAVCGKVPVFSVKKKYGLKLFKVGSPWEYVFVAVWLCVLFCICIHNFPLNPDAFAEQFRSFIAP